MRIQRIVGIVLIAMCVIAVVFGGAGTEAILPSIICCTAGLILIFKEPGMSKKKIKQKGNTNPYVDVSLYHNMTEFPKVDYNHVFLESGEVLFYATPAQTYVEREQIVGYSGGNVGVSIQAAKGISVRPGSSKGKAIKQNTVKFYSGDYVVTNKRILFISQNDGFEFDVKKISAVKMVANDAFIIMQGNRQKNICLDRSQMQYAIGLTNYVVENRDRDITYVVTYRKSENR